MSHLDNGHNDEWDVYIPEKEFWLTNIYCVNFQESGLLSLGIHHFLTLQPLWYKTSIAEKESPIFDIDFLNLFYCQQPKLLPAQHVKPLISDPMLRG